MDFQEQIDRHGFPPHVRVSAYSEQSGETVFRIVQKMPAGAQGLEIAFSGAAVATYGEAPTVIMVLDQLKRHLEEGLPEVEPGSELNRLTFAGE